VTVTGFRGFREFRFLGRPQCQDYSPNFLCHLFDQKAIQTGLRLAYSSQPPFFKIIDRLLLRHRPRSSHKLYLHQLAERNLRSGGQQLYWLGYTVDCCCNLHLATTDDNSYQLLVMADISLQWQQVSFTTTMSKLLHSFNRN